MKPWTSLLVILANVTTVIALQEQPPPKKPVSFCGFTKSRPNNTAPNCNKNLIVPCLVDNSTCSRLSDNMPYVSVLKECRCDFYYNDHCDGADDWWYDGVYVTDAILVGPIRYYKCKRNPEEGGGKRTFELGVTPLVVGALLAVVFVGL